MDNEDRGEKIVTLARTMLRQTNAQTSQTYSLKTMALVALLSASTAGVGSAFAAEHYRPLNRYEKIELLALIHYAAKMRQLETTAIQEDFYLQFSIQSLDELTYAQLTAARHFLQNTLR